MDMGTSVASALTAETIFEIMKCISDVDMRDRVRMGLNSAIHFINVKKLQFIQVLTAKCSD